jgi:hypothetical protein
MPSVRVRGIYSTALSTLLPRLGWAVVEASPVLAERLGLPRDGRAEVRLRDRPDRQALLIEGQPDALERLARALQDALPDAAARPPHGGQAWELELPGGSKRCLDEIRAGVAPTLPGHHQLKAVDAEAVDRAEQALADDPTSADSRAAKLRRRLLYRGFDPGAATRTLHVKPGGKAIDLAGRVASFEQGRLRLLRTFRPGGRYDSLGSPKLAGDHGETHCLEGSWVSRRLYLRANGKPIGELFNIQTPTELYPGTIRYLDLEVDVATWPNGRVEVVDQDELEEAVEAGYISRQLGQQALEVAERVRAVLAAGREVDLGDFC